MSIFIESYCIDAVVVGDETEVILSCGDGLNFFEAVDGGRGEVVGVSGSSPAVGTFSPGEELSGGEVSPDDFRQQHAISI